MNKDFEVSKTFDDLDNFLEGGPNLFDGNFKNYSDLINYNVFNNSLKGKVLNKISSKFLRFLHKAFMPMLDYKTKVENFVLRKNEQNYFQLSQLSEKVVQKEDLLNTHKLIDNILSSKFYATQKLIDGFKSEILVEINRNQNKSNSAEVIETKVLNASKLKSLKPLKLNIGCGRDIREDYINIDFRPLEGVDVVSDIRNIPLELNTVDEIYASHIIEHFTEYDLKEILKYWISLLKSNGKIILITPNLDKMAKDYVNGKIEWEQFRKIILGAQDYIGDFHYNAFTPKYLSEFITKNSNDCTVSIIEESRENGEAMEMVLEISKK